MRLSDLLSKAPNKSEAQVEGFLGDRKLGWGKTKRIKVGKVFHNFFCHTCNDQRTYESADELSCLGLSETQVSIDVTLQCPACNTSVETWFLLESNDDISSIAPTVSIERYTENLRDSADRVDSVGGPFSDLLKRAQLAFENGLGAGSVIYLRKIFELITYEVAGIVGVTVTKPNGKPAPFAQILREVNDCRLIIPQRFSNDGYTLFGELSSIIHGESDEQIALEKYKPCLQLVLGVVDEVNRDNEFAQAIDELGWAVDDIDEITGEGGL